MISKIQQVASNEGGYALLVILLLLLLLTAIGIAATQTSQIELKISGNTKRMVSNFYISEGSLITVMENTNRWLGDGFLISDVEAAHWLGNVDMDGDGTHDTLVEIRCVEPSQSNIPALSEAANSIPPDRHVAPPPIDSGFSARHFNIRKFAVTATDLHGGATIQSGVWKIFNKF